MTKTQKALAPGLRKKDWAGISERIQCAHDILVICGGDETCRGIVDEALEVICRALDYSYQKSLNKEEKKRLLNPQGADGK